MSEYAIRVKDVTKLYKLYDRNIDRLRDSLGFGSGKYKEHYALRNLSFDINKGECIGIIGTNGAGKSTILKIITGVLTPTSGEVEIDGRVSALLELGAGFNMEYTGIENVYLNGTMMGFSKEEIDSRLQSILDFADIGEFVNQPVKSYSSGLFVRLAFAVAINIDPEILIVDEALSVGDVFFQAKCYKKFEEFKEAGKTIVFVSHDLSSIQKYCDKAILLDKGKKIGEGKPFQIIDLYKKAMVGMLDDDDTPQKNPGDETSSKSESKSERESESSGLMKDKLQLNPDLQEYGDRLIEIIDFAVVDGSGKITGTLMKGEEFTVKVKIRTNIPTSDPIVAVTIKDTKGTDISGTNTMFEGVNLGNMSPGDERTVSFTQNADMQGGQYILSLGCTRYENNDFRVYHRLYDVCSLAIVSAKNTVGFYDMNSVITVE
ncbi:MAG: ABC transporter ATP-binding protein [Eubacterium sp.]|nr:ABC transporter ATP-binding protein [Eubacterium sp.]